MTFREAAATGILMIATVACEPGGTAAKREAATAGEQDKAGIHKIRSEYVTAWKAGNAEQVADLYTANALVLYPNHPAVEGRDGIVAYFKSFFGEFVPEDFELTSEEVEVAGAWAFDRGTYRLRTVPRAGGPATEDNGKYLVILQRQPDGSWRVARDMDNSDRPIAQSAGGPR